MNPPPSERGGKVNKSFLFFPTICLVRAHFAPRDFEKRLFLSFNIFFLNFVFKANSQRNWKTRCMFVIFTLLSRVSLPTRTALGSYSLEFHFPKGFLQSHLSPILFRNFDFYQTMLMSAEISRISSNLLSLKRFRKMCEHRPLSIVQGKPRRTYLMNSVKWHSWV